MEDTAKVRMLNKKVSNFQFNRISLEDEGRYLCTASNSDGSAEAWSDVVVTGTILQRNHFSNTLDSS